MKTLLQNKSSQILRAIFFLSVMFVPFSTQAQCTASFTAIPDSTGTGVTFINTSTGTTGTTQYYWTFGDNTFGSSQNEYHVYNSTGWFEVCLLIIDSACQSSTCDSVFAGNIVNFCQASFSYQVNGLNVSFFDFSVGTNLSYTWDFGDGNTATGLNPVHTYS